MKNEIGTQKSSSMWYQTIELKDGTVIKGKVDTRKRLPFLDQIDFRDKSVIDVGCNSGQFCLYAKSRGAGKVVGIDIFEERLAQARELAEKEQVDITYINESILHLGEMDPFDIVFCFAVVTEVEDLFGALRALRSITHEVLYLELDLAKPFLYISKSRKRSFHTDIPKSKALAEVRFSGDNLMFSPTLEVLQAFFGVAFECEYLGKSIRYDMVRVTRK